MCLKGIDGSPVCMCVLCLCLYAFMNWDTYTVVPGL